MRNNKLKAQIGYKRRYMKGGKAANILDRNFNPAKPNKRWLSEITYDRTDEGFFMLPHSLFCFLAGSLASQWMKT